MKIFSNFFLLNCILSVFIFIFFYFIVIFYSKADIRQNDIQMYECHDAFAVMAALSLESSGFVKSGEALAFAKEGLLLWWWWWVVVVGGGWWVVVGGGGWVVGGGGWWWVVVGGGGWWWVVVGGGGWWWW
jgi:hypothetical protein